MSDKVYEVGNRVSDAALLHKVEPEYSAAGRAAGARGDVANPKVLTSLGYGLDEKAIEAVMQWKFRPAYKDGKPVAVSKTVEIGFRLM